MGWESELSMASSSVGAVTKTNDAIASSKAIAETAENSAQNIADRTSRNIGSLENSFLRGGIALTGTGGPAAIFSQAAAQGNTDISRTLSNANAQISNTMNTARTAALNGIAQGASKLSSGSVNSTVQQLYSGSWLQSAWNGITGDPDPSPQGNGTANIGTYTGQ